MSLELSPLNSVSIEDIFASDPRELTPAHCTQLVTELRRRRSIFRAEEAAKAAKGKTSRTKAEPASAPKAAELDKPLGELDLGDLMK